MSCTASRRKPPSSPASHNLLKPCPSLARWSGSRRRRNRAEPLPPPRRQERQAAPTELTGDRGTDGSNPSPSSGESVSSVSHCLRLAAHPPLAVAAPGGAAQTRADARRTCQRPRVTRPFGSGGEIGRAVRSTSPWRCFGAWLVYRPSRGLILTATVSDWASCKMRYDLGRHKLVGLHVVSIVAVDQQLYAGIMVLADQIHGLGHGAHEAP